MREGEGERERARARERERANETDSVCDSLIKRESNNGRAR